MAERKNRKIFMEWLLAAGTVCLLTLLYLFFRSDFGRGNKEGEAFYEIVILGDSVIANVGDGYGDGVDVYLEEQTGKRVLRGAFGGSRASYDSYHSMPIASQDPFCLVRLAEALCSHDFRAQHAQVNNGIRYINANNQTPEYFPDVLAGLEALDLEQTRYLIVEHGTNDYNSACRIDNPENPKDVTTFGGALRYGIEKLRNKYPNVNIVLLTPVWCAFNRDGEWLDCRQADFGCGTLEDYVEKELSIAREYGLPVIDAFHDSPIQSDTLEYYLMDGLHLRPEGQRALAELIAERLRELEEGGSHE